MKLTKLITPFILSAALLQTSAAQDNAADKKTDILKKGSTWHYDVIITIPEGVQASTEVEKKGEVVGQNTIYRFKETQQSIGQSMVDDLEAEATRVNIYLDDTLSKQQLLTFDSGALLYYGTYTINLEKPDVKAGYVTKAPIILYSKGFEVAKKWEWKQNKLPAFKFRLISKDSKVETKAGTFIANKIRMEQVDNSSGKTLITKDIWFVDSIGVVKEIEKQFIPGGKAIQKILELTKFGTEPLK